MTRHSDIHEAIEVAAGLDIATGIEIGRKRHATDARIANAKRMVRLFLESVDPDLTVLELLEEMDGAEARY